jgi:RHS repeat-associated protein
VWVFALGDLTLALAGDGVPLALPVLTGTNQFVGNVFSQPLALDPVFPASSFLAVFDAVSKQWGHRFPPVNGSAGLNDAPGFLLPGQVLWTTGATGPIGQDLTRLQMRYYHQDHLGSTSVITDQEGALIEETANYPFGSVRNSFRPDATIAADPYGFTQSERDLESGLHCIEARFLAANLGRFTRVDPTALALKPEWLADPQLLNSYVYARNNPIKLVDPSGREGKPSMMLNFKDVGGGAISDAKYSYHTVPDWTLRMFPQMEAEARVNVYTYYSAKVEVFTKPYDQKAVFSDKVYTIESGRAGLEISSEIPKQGFMRVTLTEQKVEIGGKDGFKSEVREVASGTGFYTRTGTSDEMLMFNVERGQFGSTSTGETHGVTLGVPGGSISAGDSTGVTTPTSSSGLDIKQIPTK